MAVSTPLIGRVEELARLDGALKNLSGDSWSAVEVVGEAGIGKTRLLDELTRRADRRGALVLAGSASELERDLPFWVFVNALDDYIRGLDPRVLELLDAEDRAELAHVFPALAGLGGGGDTPLALQRYRTHRAVRGLLERLAATRPLVLVLDDFHWADPASVELLGGLLRRPPDAGVLVALALRPDRRVERLTAEIQRSHGAETFARIALGAITRDDAEQLLGDSVDGEVASALYDESGGNPFYLEQLARSLSHGSTRPGVNQQLPKALHVPPVVAATLAEELARLSDTSHLVLQGAAVVGDPFEPEMAAAAAGVSELTALAALDELTRSALVRQTATPRRFRFRHPIVRRAVYETAPAGWRLRAHELSASALASRGATASERAHHVERSGRKGDHEAVATLHQAGEETVHRAPESAARWFGGALRLLRDDAPAEYRVELLLARAGALASSGHFVEGYAALLESIELVPAEAVALRVRLTTACAGMEHLLGHHEMAHGRLAAALEELPVDMASPEAAALRIELAVDGVYRMQFSQMASQATEALAAARPLGNHPLVATAAAARAWGTALAGFVPAARTYHAEASVLVDELSDQELALRLDSAVHLAGAELYLDLFESAGSHAERVIAVARETGQPAFIPFAFMVLAWVRMLRGELADGAETLDAAIEEARLLGNTQSVAGLLLNRSLTAVAAGDLELAAATARESVALTEGMDDGLIPAAATLSLAAALLEKGDPGLGDAVELMVRRCGGPELPSMPGGSFRTKWLELLTRCLLALDRRAEADQAAAHAQAIVDPLGGLRMATAMAERAAAAVALDAGDPHEAARRALASAAAADQVGIPVEAALSRIVAGRALAGADQGSRAVTELERAAAALHDSGAVKYRDAAELELRRLGQHVHRRSAPGVAAVGVASLTHREREVADLVVDRRTNPQIAAALFVSCKTVETHLRHIFHKLDVTSRVEVARAIEAAPRPE